MPQTEFWPFIKNKAVEDVDFSSDSTLSLQKQLGDMEGEVKEIQMELAAIKECRLTQNYCKGEDPDIVTGRVHLENMSSITEENNTFVEVSKLREDLIRVKNVADQERFEKEMYEKKLKDLEQKLNGICSVGNSDSKIKETSAPYHEAVTMKSKLREMEEEMEEMRFTINEKTEQLQDYRVKYLQAQQQVEELKRQLDLVEFDNKQVTDQIQIEIQKIKMQFQEKLQELSPLPDLLKGSQIQLQEAKQLQKLAEDNSRQLSNELQRVKEKLVATVNSLNQEKNDKAKVIEMNVVLKSHADERLVEVNSLTKNLDEHKCKVMRFEEKLSQLELRYEEKSKECTKLLQDLQEMRTENGKSMIRAKERAESMRRYLQAQISELERQLIQSRAQCRTCQKERDEIRQKMQIQLNNLQESFELGEIRLRTLYNQVASLKNSYTNILCCDDNQSELGKITII